MRSARRRRRRVGRATAKVADSWQRWVADNLLRGVAEARVVEALIANDVPPRLARSTVAEIASSPGLAAARSERRHAHALSMACRLLSHLREGSELARIPHPDAATFFRTHWQSSTPALFTDIVTRWPALTEGRWTPQRLAARFGDVEIEACVGRAGDPRPDANWEQHRRTMTMRAFVERVLAASPTNDLYLIANNRTTHRPELAALWDDVVLPSGWFHQADVARGSALWLGPAGTVTPLHHDTSSILFCQVVGRKHLALAPPWCEPLLREADGVYCRLSLEQARRRTTLIELTLEPGDAVFIPVGWWHELRALDVSVSLALNGFARPNSLAWYRPGSRVRTP